MAASKLFWSARAAAEGQQSAALTPSTGPEGLSAEFVEGTDVVYPAPGGGLLRVPVGGGAPAELLGDADGQIAYWSAAGQQWVRTTAAPADGEVPAWDATAGEWLFRPVAGVSADKADHFMLGQSSVSGNESVGTVGDLRWKTVFGTTTGNVSQVTSEDGHPGIVILASAAASGLFTMYLGDLAAAEDFISPENIDFCEWVVRARAGRTRFGLGSDPDVSNLGNDGIVITPDSATDPNYRVLSRQGGSSTVVVTDVPVGYGGPWLTWRIQRVSAAVWRVFANGVLKAEFDSGNGDFVPGAAIQPAAQAVGTGVSGQIDIDSFFFKSTL